MDRLGLLIRKTEIESFQSLTHRNSSVGSAKESTQPLAKHCSCPATEPIHCGARGPGTPGAPGASRFFSGGQWWAGFVPCAAFWSRKISISILSTSAGFVPPHALPSCDTRRGLQGLLLWEQTWPSQPTPTYRNLISPSHVSLADTSALGISHWFSYQIEGRSLSPIRTHWKAWMPWICTREKNSKHTNMSKSNSKGSLAASKIYISLLDLSLPPSCFPECQDFSFSTSFLACEGGYVEWASPPLQQPQKKRKVFTACFSFVP